MKIYSWLSSSKDQTEPLSVLHQTKGTEFVLKCLQMHEFAWRCHLLNVNKFPGQIFPLLDLFVFVKCISILLVTIHFNI